MEYLATNIICDEEFYVGVVSNSMARVISMINEPRKKQYLTSNFIIKHIQVGWNGMIDILRSLKERCSPLEDRKTETSFKIIDTITKLGGPLLARDSTMIFVDDLEVEASKLYGIREG